MSQMWNNRPDEGENNSERCSGESRGRNQNHPEGFEGMNYELRRPSFPLQSTTGNDSINRGNREKRPDEL